MSSPRFGFSYLSEGQAQAEIPLNQNTNIMEALMSCAITNRTTSAPPGSPANGDTYLVKATASGAWTGQENNLAIYYDGWYFVTPKAGLLATITAENQIVRYDGSNWLPVAGGYKTLTYAASMTIDAKDALKQYVALTGNVAVTLTAGSFNGQELHLAFKQDGTGSRLLTITLGLGSTYSASTLSTGANLLDIMVLEWSSVLTKWVLKTFTKGIS